MTKGRDWITNMLKLMEHAYCIYAYYVYKDVCKNIYVMALYIFIVYHSNNVKS